MVLSSPTDHYIKMLDGLQNAERLVTQVNPISCNTDLQHLKLQSYILIVHSIFEEYIESVCKDASISAKKSYKDDGQITKAMVSLIATCVVDRISEKSKKKVSSDLAQNLLLFLSDAVTAYHHKIKENHGITRKDQQELLLPLGIDLETFDLGLSENLNNFGSTRGDIAHQFKIKREHTLSDITGKINQIKTDLRGLDHAICNSCTPLVVSV